MSPKENTKSNGLYKASSTPRLSIVSYTPIGKHKRMLIDYSFCSKEFRQFQQKIVNLTFCDIHRD